MKEIGKLFQEKLGGFQQMPSEKIWENVSQNPIILRYNKLKQIKRAIVYSSSAVAVATAILALWLTATQASKQLSTQPSTPFVEVPHSQGSTVDVVVDSLKVDAIVPTTTPTTIPRNAAECRPTPEHVSLQAMSTTPASASAHLAPEATVAAGKTAEENSQNERHSENSTRHAMQTESGKKNRTVDSEHSETTRLPEQNNSTPQTESFADQIPPMEAYDITAPNAFSPNGDGLNDAYKLVAPFEISAFYFAIYTKAGQLIFQSNDINHAWTGEYNGSPLPEGVYSFVLKYNDEFDRMHRKTGSILLFR